MKAAVKFVTLVLLIIGGMNWLLIGLADINLVSVLFGHATIIARAIYIAIGASAIYILANFTNLI